MLPFLETAVFAGALALGWAAAVWLRSGSAPRTRWLARNPNTPPDQLAELAVDADSWLALELARHPQLPAELRVELFERAVASDDEYVRIHVAIQPLLPPRLLRELARDEKPLARRNVAANRATPLDVLETLAADPDESARSMADHMLARRTSIATSPDR